MQLAVELIDFFLSSLQCLAAGGGDAVDAPLAALRDLMAGFQQPCTLKPMEQRIESSGTDAIAVVRQFVHDFEPEDRLLGGVQQHVDANQAMIQVAPKVPHTHHYTGKPFTRLLT